jgi:hypothetical protein
MRLVVLLAAEERRLLPADDPVYSASYSVLAARDQLERDAMREGIETLEKRHTAWHRLLATFRAVHGSNATACVWREPFRSAPISFPRLSAHSY